MPKHMLIYELEKDWHLAIMYYYTVVSFLITAREGTFELALTIER